MTHKVDNVFIVSVKYLFVYYVYFQEGKTVIGSCGFSDEQGIGKNKQR